MLPYDHLQYTFSIIRRSLWMLGIEFMDPDFRINWRTKNAIIIMSVGWASGVYTVLCRESEMALKCLTILGLASQGNIVLIVLLRSSSLFRDKFEYFLTVFRHCGVHSREAATLIAWQGPINLVVRLFCGVIIVNLAVFCATPVIQYMRDGRQTCLLPLMFPGVDENQLVGFIGLTILQLGATLAGGFGTLGSGLTIVVLFLCVCALADLLMLKLRMLQVGILDGGPSVEQRPETRAYLHNIIRLHVEFVTQLKSLCDLFYPIFLAEILMDSISMCMIMFVLKMVEWVPLYLFWGMFFLKMLAACLLGAIISTYCDRLYEAFVRFPWYHLAQADRWKIVIIIQRLQNPSVLMCGTLKMNMELFVAVMKNTYTVAILLNEMAE